VGRCDVLVGIGHEGGEEGLADAAVEEEGGDAEAEEGVALGQAGEHIGHQLGVVGLAQLVDRRTDFIIIGVVLLADLANDIGEGRLAPVIHWLPHSAANNGLEGDLELGDEEENLVRERGAGQSPRSVDGGGIHGNTALCC
jgi:hypothetical protein